MRSRYIFMEARKKEARVYVNNNSFKIHDSISVQLCYIASVFVRVHGTGACVVKDATEKTYIIRKKEKRTSIITLTIN